MLSRYLFVLACFAGASFTGPASSADWTAISWNVESGGAEPAVIARQLGELPGATVFAL